MWFDLNTYRYSTVTKLEDCTSPDKGYKTRTEGSCCALKGGVVSALRGPLQSCSDDWKSFPIYPSPPSHLVLIDQYFSSLTRLGI